MEGLTLRVRGVLLEHRAAAAAVQEARLTARLRVRVPAVRDWVIDYSSPGALWIVSDGAWYRWGPPPVLSLEFVSVMGRTVMYRAPGH